MKKIWIVLLSTVGLTYELAWSQLPQDKIKSLVREEIERSFKDSNGGYSRSEVNRSLTEIQIRLRTLTKSVLFFVRTKLKEAQVDIKRHEIEIGRACCPIRPRVLVGEDWIGRKSKNRLKQFGEVDAGLPQNRRLNRQGPGLGKQGNGGQRKGGNRRRRQGRRGRDGANKPAPNAPTPSPQEKGAEAP
ncbi:MAG: hypothetical protein AB7F86_16675 [Bdellovibrionales bacterium]